MLLLVSCLKIFAYSKVRKVSSAFLLKRVPFHIRSAIYLVLACVYGVRSQDALFFPCGYLDDPVPLTEKTILSPPLCCHLCHDGRDYVCVGWLLPIGLGAPLCSSVPCARGGPT